MGAALVILGLVLWTINTDESYPRGYRHIIDATAHKEFCEVFIENRKTDTCIVINSILV